jgi:hypothetical protein
MADYNIILEMLKAGFILSLILGFFYLIYWSIKKNILWIYHKLTDKDKETVNWIKDGYKKGYKDEQLATILFNQGYSPKSIIKYLKKTKKIINKEVQNDKGRERNLRSLEKQA